MPTFGATPARTHYLEQVVAARRRPDLAPPPMAPATIARVLVIESDRVYRDILVSLVKSLFLSATLSFAGSLGDADLEIGERQADLVIADPIAANGDLLDMLPRWRASTGCHILLTTSQPPPALLASMSEIGVTGIFDRTTGSVAELQAALADVGRGIRYFSPIILERLFQECVSPRSAYACLTDTERMVLGVIGDGCDDTSAAVLLAMTPLGVKSMRRQLHRKLGVQHRGELQQRAVALGFFVPTAFGSIRPGLAALLAARAADRDRPPRRPTSNRCAA